MKLLEKHNRLAQQMQKGTKIATKVTRRDMRRTTLLEYDVRRRHN